MGRSRGIRRKFKHMKQDGQNKWDDNAPRKPYKSLLRENSGLEKYYKTQCVCPSEEFCLFMSILKENLPTAFRITGSKAEARALLRIVKSQFFDDVLNPNKTEIKQDGDDIEERMKPISLPWYPDSLAWQLQLTRKDIRRSEAYFRLHNFLISETACGNISRQEVVSMIPPLMLQVKSHHKVLDMCAAPGSKTAQLIELLHSEDEQLPEGFVIANDIDNSRCYMLVHQAKRLNSPCIVITNHDSSVMPNLISTDKDGRKVAVKFDRILCDVPCSGDGTLRKNPDIWMKWSPTNGNNLHGIQYRIVRRGVEMLAVGGRLVYSTCSLNPVENEAVLHRLLLDAKGAVELVDVSDLLPGLKYDKGLSSWQLVNRDLSFFKRFEDVPEMFHTVIRPQMFPPSEEDAPKFHLDRCIRILPHRQDTGAFFVAVLEKTSHLPWESAGRVEPSGSTDSVESSITSSAGTVVEEDKLPKRKKRRIQGYKEDPFIFFDDSEPLWPVIKEFYDISDDLPGNCLLTRCREGKKKNIYFTSPAVRDIVLNNSDNIKLINTGVKTFVRCDNKTMGCSFRLAQEGLHSILPFIGPKRKIKVTKSDFIKLLSCDNPKQPPEVTSLDVSTQEQLSSISQGSCVLVYKEEVGDASSGTEDEPLVLSLVGWRGIKSVRAYVPTNDCVHYLRLCGEDVSRYEKNKFKDRAAEEATVPENIADDPDFGNLTKEDCDEDEVVRKCDQDSRNSSPTNEEKLTFECID